MLARVTPNSLYSEMTEALTQVKSTDDGKDTLLLVSNMMKVLLQLMSSRLSANQVLSGLI